MGARRVFPSGGIKQASGDRWAGRADARGDPGMRGRLRAPLLGRHGPRPRCCNGKERIKRTRTRGRTVPAGAACPPALALGAQIL